MVRQEKEGNKAPLNGRCSSPSGQAVLECFLQGDQEAAGVESAVAALTVNGGIPGLNRSFFHSKRPQEKGDGTFDFGGPVSFLLGPLVR